MDRRGFMARLLAAPLAGAAALKLAEWLPATKPALVRIGFDAQLFRSQLQMSNALVEDSIVPMLDMMMADTADAIRRNLEDYVINDPHGAALFLAMGRRAKRPSKARRLNPQRRKAAWRRAMGPGQFALGPDRSYSSAAHSAPQKPTGAAAESCAEEIAR